MENVKQESIEKGEEKKKGFGAKVFDFLAKGGIILVMAACAGIFILIHKLMK